MAFASDKTGRRHRTQGKRHDRALSPRPFGATAAERRTNYSNLRSRSRSGAQASLGSPRSIQRWTDRKPISSRIMRSNGTVALGATTGMSAIGILLSRELIGNGSLLSSAPVRSRPSATGARVAEPVLDVLAAGAVPELDVDVIAEPLAAAGATIGRATGAGSNGGSSPWPGGVGGFAGSVGTGATQPAHFLRRSSARAARLAARTARLAANTACFAARAAARLAARTALSSAVTQGWWALLARSPSRTQCDRPVFACRSPTTARGGSASEGSAGERSAVSQLVGAGARTVIARPDDACRDPAAPTSALAGTADSPPPITATTRAASKRRTTQPTVILRLSARRPTNLRAYIATFTTTGA